MIKTQKLSYRKSDFNLLRFIAYKASGSQRKADKLFNLAYVKAQEILSSPSKYYKGVKVSQIDLDNEFQRQWLELSIAKSLCKKCKIDYDKIRTSYFVHTNYEIVVDEDGEYLFFILEK